MEEPSLEGIDARVRRQSYAVATNAIQLLDQLILHINNGKARLTGKKHDRGLNFLVGLMLGRAFNSLWKARESAVTGYPAESLTLCRSALEHWAAARWVEFNPECTDRWLWAILSEVTQPKEWPPSPDRTLKELRDLGADLHYLYDPLSKFAHPKSAGLSWMIHFDPQSTYFHTGGHFDERGIRMCLFFLVGVAQACLEPVARLQDRMLGSPDAEWLEQGKELSKQAKALRSEMEQEVASEAEKAGR